HPASAGFSRATGSVPSPLPAPRRISPRVPHMAEAPLATRMRPRTLEEVVGQRHLIGPGRPLSLLVQSGHIPSLLLWGPAGSGKTTIAHLVGAAVGGELVQLSAVASGVADARKVMGRAKGSL